MKQPGGGKTAKVKPARRAWPWQAEMPGVALVLLVLTAYLPALSGQFIWDDDYNIIKSAPVRALGGIWRIWFEPGATQQYYPLTHSSFWLDYHLWGLHPFPYHAENILLQAISAVLLWRILRRLEIPGAWFGAALFALHPVCVESVAWITERKNALSGVCFLAAIAAAIEFWLPRASVSAGRAQSPEQSSELRFGSRKFYWLAVVLYLCALWSKTAMIAMPGVLLLLAWWKRGRLVRKDAVLLLPFLAVGLGMAMATVTIEHRLMRINALPEEWQFSGIDRLQIAGRALWFYLGKLCWPYPVMFVYPRWRIETVLWPGILGLVAAVAGVILLWQKRGNWGRPVLVAAGYFVLLLLPVLGYFNVFFFRYSFVCDHFQYLACLGPLALAGAGIGSALRRVPAEKRLLGFVAPAALLSVLGALTWHQAGVYHSLETLWRDSIAKNPDAWMARDNLGVCLSQAGRFDEADEQYRKAIEIRPKDFVVYYDLGLECAIRGDLDGAARNFSKTLEIFPGYAFAHYQLGNVLTRAGKLDDAIVEYNKALETSPGLALGHYNLAAALARKGKLDEAIAQCTETLRWDPEFAGAPFTIGNILAGRGKLEEAIEAYNRALDIQPDYAPAHAALGRALTARGQLQEAISHCRKAIEIDPKSTDAYASLGSALVAQGRLEEAESDYRSALQLDPRSPVLHYDLSVVLTRQGRASEAATEWAEAKRLEAASRGGR